MQSSSNVQSSRNEPCTCGSGKKYKQCCGQRAPNAGAPTETTPLARSPGSRGWSLLLALLGVIAVVFLILNLLGSRPPADSASDAPATENFTDTSRATPPAWYHDVANNRHWDPAHQHWHDGPPPGGAASPSSSALPSGASEAPAPFQYDAENDRHWDPGHQHWHDGPPPETGS